MIKEICEVYAYSFEADQEDLRALAMQMGETFFWVADLSMFQVGKGLPERLTDRGSIFGSIGEIRWQRTEDVFKLLIITDRTDKPLKGLEGHTPIDGDWQAEAQQIFLQDLMEPRVNPQFLSYPHGESRGKMRVMAVCRNGVPVLMSPREILSEEEA